MATPIFFQRNCVAHRSRKKSFIAALHHGIIKKNLKSKNPAILRTSPSPHRRLRNVGSSVIICKRQGRCGLK
jgi:hypothetical protein